MRENDILKGEQGALKRALYKSMGFTGEQLGKPIIAIANSYTNATPGHFVLKQLCESVPIKVFLKIKTFALKVGKPL